DGEADEARRDVGLADISASAKLSVRGRGVAALVEKLAGSTPAAKSKGVGRLDCPDAALACRLTDDHLLLLSLTEKELRPEIQGADVLQVDVTSAFAGFCLAGPRTEDLLRRLTALDVRAGALPVHSCAETSLGGVEALLIRAPALSLPAM